MFDEELAHWISEEVCFPNSMVDRITPVTTAELIQDLERDFGIVDEWPVFAEDFSYWVIEYKFLLGRPKWETAGALFTDDVLPYAKMKLRLLNGSGFALAYLSAVHGHRRVDKATRDPLIRRFTLGYIDECTSTPPPVPGINLYEYKQSIVDRFSNSQLCD